MNKRTINKYTNPSSDNYRSKLDRNYTVMTITVIGFFIGFGLCIGFYSYTLINIFELSKFMVLFGIVGFLIPLRFYNKWFHFIKYEMIIFNVMGVAPFLTGLFLFLNFTFVSNSYTHYYKIEKIYFEGESSFKSMGVVLENNFFSGERKIVELTDVSPNDLVEKKFLKLTISEGIFGYDVIKEKILIK